MVAGCGLYSRSGGRVMRGDSSVFSIDMSRLIDVWVADAIVADVTDHGE